MLIKLINKNSKNDTTKQFFETVVFLLISMTYTLRSFSINLIIVLIFLYLIFLMRSFFYKSGKN